MALILPQHSSVHDDVIMYVWQPAVAFFMTKSSVKVPSESLLEASLKFSDFIPS